METCTYGSEAGCRKPTTVRWHGADSRAYFYVEDKWELYDLKTDPTEMHNLYGKQGMEKVTAELMAELARLQKQYEVPQNLCK